MYIFLNLILKYVKIYLLSLGLTYLFNQLWDWFQGDSLLENAVIITLAVIAADLANKLISKKDNRC